ncbi:unnamed protein product, partial [Didymodactylos carnosus]
VMFTVLKSIDNLLEKFNELSQRHQNLIKAFKSDLPDVDSPLRDITRDEEIHVVQDIPTAFVHIDSTDDFMQLAKKPKSSIQITPPNYTLISTTLNDTSMRRISSEKSSTIDAEIIQYPTIIKPTKKLAPLPSFALIQSAATSRRRNLPKNTTVPPILIKPTTPKMKLPHFQAGGVYRSEVLSPVLPRHIIHNAVIAATINHLARHENSKHRRQLPSPRPFLVKQRHPFCHTKPTVPSAQVKRPTTASISRPQKKTKVEITIVRTKKIMDNFRSSISASSARTILNTPRIISAKSS